MSSTYTEAKSVVAERFIRTLKGKIFNKITANDNKSDFGYFNMSVEEYNNNYYCSIGKKNPNPAGYSVMSEEFESSQKAPNFKVDDRSMITKYENIFSKGCTKKWSKEIFLIDLMLKANTWRYKTKHLNGNNNNKLL